MAPIGSLTGTFLAPGWSKNKRYYSPELIADSAADMASRLEAGKPIPMMGCHDTNSTLEQVAAIRKVWTDGSGRGRYSADIPDTSAGRDLLALTTPDPATGERFLNSVSIYGGWVGDVRSFEKDGTVGTTGDQLKITRVDFVDDPGVEAARLDPQSAPAPGEGELIESLGASFTPLTESAPPAQFHDLVEDAPAATVTETAPEAGSAAAAKSPSARDQLAAIAAAATEAMVRIDAFTSGADRDAPMTDVSLSSYGVDNADLPAQAAQLGKAADAAIRAASSTADTSGAAAGEEPTAVLVMCRSCSAEVGGDDTYCSGCGELLAESAPDRENQEISEMGPTKCGGCGGDVPASAKYCPNCGAETKTKTEDGGSESAPGTQEVPVTEQTGGDLATQIAAGIAEAFKQAGIGAPTEKPEQSKSAGATETTEKPTETPATETAPAAAPAPATEAVDVSALINEAFTQRAEADKAARAEETKALVTGLGEAMTKGLTALRDEFRTELQASGQGGQRTGFPAGTPAERLAAMPTREQKDWSQMTATEREQAFQDHLAEQMNLSGIYSEGLAEQVRTQHRHAS